MCRTFVSYEKSIEDFIYAKNVHKFLTVNLINMSRISEKSANKENSNLLKTEDDELKVNIPQYCKLKCDHLESLIFNAKIFCESNNLP